MDQDSAANEHDESTPIFTAYRRGYDPDQVDRYVADQRRRLDEATHRASEAERKLAAAVGQLRELHRRVAVLESEDRGSAQAPAIDSIGERIQRILQEAWDGAYAMRQAAEIDSNELKERARGEAEEIVAAARLRAESIGEELERRRRGYLQRVEEERAKAVSQMTFLQKQRKLALDELNRIRTLIDTTIEEFADDQPARPSTARRAAREAPLVTERPIVAPNPSESVAPAAAQAPEMPHAPVDRPAPLAEAVARPTRPSIDTGHLPRTMPVHTLNLGGEDVDADPSELVRAHRALREMPEGETATVHVLDAERRRNRPALFDFEASTPEGDA